MLFARPSTATVLATLACALFGAPRRAGSTTVSLARKTARRRAKAATERSTRQRQRRKS